MVSLRPARLSSFLPDAVERHPHVREVVGLAG